MPKASSRKSTTRKNHTLEKGLDILSLFTLTTPELSALELRQRLAIPTSTVYRLLRSMKTKRWIEDDGNGKYRLGLRLLELARVVRARLHIVDIARREMLRLSEKTGETMLLTALSGNQAVCIDLVEGRHAVRVSMDRGVAMPLHAGASSVVLLAFLDEVRRDEILQTMSLKRYTPSTITDPKQLQRRLGRVRVEGYVFSDQEVDVGVRGIGAPVLDKQNQIIAGLSLVAPAPRIPDSRVGELSALVKAAALRISTLALD